MVNQCLNCKKNTNNNKFCSSSCSATFNNLKRRNRNKNYHSQQFINKLIESNKARTGEKRVYPHTKIKFQNCENCDYIFVAKRSKDRRYRKSCSEDCRRILLSKFKSNWLKNKDNHKKLPRRNEKSYMERSFEEWLISNGLSRGLHGFLTEINFINKNNKKPGWTDFVFPKQKLIIELDGTQHRKRKQLDMIRDDYLKSKNWIVIRITHKEYKNKSKLDLIKQLLNL